MGNDVGTTAIESLSNQNSKIESENGVQMKADEADDQLEGSESNDDDLEQAEDTEEVADLKRQLTSLPFENKIHSARYREYCKQVITQDFNQKVTQLLKKLWGFHLRQLAKDPAGASRKKRLVFGLREVLKSLKKSLKSVTTVGMNRRLKCVVITPDLQKIESEGGLDDLVNEIVTCSLELNVPVVYALNKRKMDVFLRSLV